MVLAILALLIAGGVRLSGLRRLPTPRTVGRWLRAFRAEHLLALQWVNALLVARAIRHAGVRRLTIDVDGSVVSTGQQVQWAQRGLQPPSRQGAELLSDHGLRGAEVEVAQWGRRFRVVIYRLADGILPRLLAMGTARLRLKETLTPMSKRLPGAQLALGEDQLRSST